MVTLSLNDPWQDRNDPWPDHGLDANVTMWGSRMSQGAAMLTEGGGQVASDNRAEGRARTRGQ